MRRLGDSFAARTLAGKLLIACQRRLIVRQRARHRQMVARGAAHADARVTRADVYFFRPAATRQRVDQPRAVLLLILFAPGGRGIAAMVAGADAVRAELRADRREIAVVAEHGLQRVKAGRAGHVAHLTGNRVGR